MLVAAARMWKTLGVVAEGVIADQAERMERLVEQLLELALEHDERLLVVLLDVVGGAEGRHLDDVQVLLLQHLPIIRIRARLFT